MSASAARVATRGIARRRRGLAAAVAGPPPSMPLVAVLGSGEHAAGSVGAVALALARVLGTSAALAGVVGAPQRTPVVGGLPAARRVAARLRERRLPALAAGRLVWLALDPDAELQVDDGGGPAEQMGSVRDDAGLAAAMAATLGRAASAVRVPAALALPLARTDALDRVLGWHDAFVVVRDAGAADVVVERALASLARLGRPVATMPPAPRLAAACATAGLSTPSAAAATIAQLGLGDERRPRG